MTAVAKEHQVARLRRRPRDRIAKLETALKNARMSHQTCEDNWYSCPKSSEGCSNDAAGDECTCGADEHNAAIDAALKE